MVPMVSDTPIPAMVYKIINMLIETIISMEGFIGKEAKDG